MFRDRPIQAEQHEKDEDARNEGQKQHPPPGDQIFQQPFGHRACYFSFPRPALSLSSLSVI